MYTIYTYMPYIDINNTPILRDFEPNLVLLITLLLIKIC